MIQLKERVTSAKTFEDFLNILGEPDERYGAITHDPQQKQIHGMRDVKRGLRYSSLAETLIMDVQEYEDGEVIFFFSGKLIPKGSA